jgi:hypothetical protein
VNEAGTCAPITPAESVRLTQQTKQANVAQTQLLKTTPHLRQTPFRSSQPPTLYSHPRQLYTEEQPGCLLYLAVRASSAETWATTPVSHPRARPMVHAAVTLSGATVARWRFREWDLQRATMSRAEHVHEGTRLT